MKAPIPEIVRLEEQQIGNAASSLARGFFSDPLAVHMIPNPGQRATSLPIHFSAALRLGNLFGHVHTTQGLAQGAAVWFRPDRGAIGPAELEQAGVNRLEHELPAGAFGRFVSVTDHLEEFHKLDVPAEHWYLALLGVDPELRGKGVGSALLQPILRRADEERLPCYLETLAPDNIPFYRKHGFDVVRDNVEPGSGLRYWTCLRPPLDW